MSGTKAGGAKLKATILEKYGPEYYSTIGKAGAKAYNERLAQRIAKPRGFAIDPEKARLAGMKGGRRKHEKYASNNEVAQEIKQNI